jgi:hypothetical protein
MHEAAPFFFRKGRLVGHPFGVGEACAIVGRAPAPHAKLSVDPPGRLKRSESPLYGPTRKGDLDPERLDAWPARAAVAVHVFSERERNDLLRVGEAGRGEHGATPVHDTRKPVAHTPSRAPSRSESGSSSLSREGPSRFADLVRVVRRRDSRRRGRRSPPDAGARILRLSRRNARATPASSSGRMRI